ncbi:MAG: hypothetical protein Q7T65_14505 [Thiobacillus sp.]|nr:hypothetical protein [Thiobacillus sp.]
MTERTYIRVFWIHESPTDPIDLWSELDESRFETRKLEYFRDGRVGYASKTEEAEGTRLGIGPPIPPLDIIASDPQFSPEEVSVQAFEDRWRSRKLTGHPHST